VFDALSHLPLFATAEDARAYLDQAAGDGVTDAMCAGTEPRRDEWSAHGAQHGVRVHRVFGIHPEHASDDALAAQLRALQTRLDEGAVAIGECGIDHRDGFPSLKVQARTLSAQLDIARARQLPVILHLVAAWERALDIIEHTGAAALPAGGIWHAFAGPKEAIARAQACGLAFSIGGLVLNPHARRLREALPFIPPELLVVETDMPHAPPVRLASVVDELARLLGADRADVARRTATNARRIFRIPG
jgi:TatD DNase family protein